MLCNVRLETLTSYLSASDWEVLTLVGILKSPIIIWFSRRLTDRSWNSSRKSEVEDEGGR